MSKNLSIAILGTRGIPARYGGFETFAEQISARLSARGHTVCVYARRRFGEVVPDTQVGAVRVRSVPTIMHKYLETPLHALMSFLDLLNQKFDVVLLCNAANSPFAWLVRLWGLPLAINVDGIERERSKWNSFGKLWYRLGEICSVWFGSKVIADAEVIAQYYRKSYGIAPVVIAYGAEPQVRPPGEVLRKFKLEPRRYVLYVSRLEPENNALGVIQAYASLPTTARTMPLVIVGDAPYASEYKSALTKAACPEVIFTGFQFGEAYQELRSHCYCYIQATEVGGTHPALVEAMAYGNAVLANDVPEHREVLGETGEYYPKNNFPALATLLSAVLVDPKRAERLGAAAKARANQRYCWDAITTQYEDLLRSLVP